MATPSNAPGGSESAAPKPGTYKLNDGSTLTVRADGSRIVVRPDGRRLVEDAQGNVIDVGQQPTAGDKASHRDTGITSTGKTATENKFDAQDRQSPAGQAQQDASNSAAAVSNVVSSDAGGSGGFIFINGQMAVRTGIGANGVPTYAYTGVRDNKGNVSQAPSQLGGTNSPSEVIDPTTGLPMAGGTTAFDALNMGAAYGVLAGIKGSDQFTLASNTPLDINTGAPISDGYRPATGDHSAAANTVNGTSQMTIAEGVQWLAKLSNQNPQAYDQMVQELKHAGYTGSQGEPLTGGGYSETVGVAFAKAAKDLAVMQQSTGSNIGLDEYLQNRQAAVKQAAEENYQPVARDYADNGSLAAAAKSAAEDALGRNLTADELARFQSSFHSQQTSYYNQYDAAKKAQAGAAAIGDQSTVAGPSGSMPDASGQASALVQGGQFAQDRDTYAVQNYTQALAQLFGVK